MASQAGGGSAGLSGYVSPKGTPSYAQLRAATPYRGTAVNAPLNGGGNSANAVEHDLLAKLAQQKSAAASSIPAPPNPGNPMPGANLDPSVMAAAQFAPQYQLLNQMAQQSTQRYNQAGHDVGGMWDALSKSIAGGENAIKQNYGQTGSAIGKAYNEATAATDNTFSSSRNQIADIAQRLGVQAAVPQALAGGAEQQQRLDAMLNAASANHRSVNAGLGQNEVNYNRNNAQTARYAGVNARADFQGKLQQALQDLGNKRLTLQGDQAAATNKYGMDITQMNQTAQAARDSLAQKTEATQSQRMLDLAKLKQQNDQFNATHNNDTASKNLSPYELVASLANKLYTNPTAATNAKNAVTDTLAEGFNGKHTWTNAADFIDSVMQRNPNANHSGGDYRQLQQMALEFYARLAGGADRPLK